MQDTRCRINDETLVYIVKYCVIRVYDELLSNSDLETKQVRVALIIFPFGTVIVDIISYFIIPPIVKGIFLAILRSIAVRRVRLFFWIVVLVPLLRYKLSEGHITRLDR